MKITKYLTILFLIISFFLVMPINVVWGEATTDEESQQEVDSLDWREIEAILAETDNQESDRLTIKKAFCGNLVSHKKDDQEITIEVRSQERVGHYDDETIMVGITREKISPQDLEAGNYIIAMGYFSRLDSDDQLLIRRLVVQETPTPINRESFFGRIGDISSEEEVFVLDQDGLVFEVLASKADLSYQDEDGQVIIGQFNQLGEQDRVIVIGQRKDGNGQISANRIHIITVSTLEDS